MSPIRIKVYGLIRMSRRTYLICQGVALVVLIVLLFSRMWLPLPTSTTPPNPWVEAGKWLIHHLHWLVLAVLVVEVIEMFIVLRRFAQAERERED